MNVIETAAWLLFETMFYQSIRLRIGISYGDVHIDPKNNIYIGQAIVDAYEMERVQLWSGGALTEEAANQVIQPYPWTIPYDVPCRNAEGQQETRNMLAVNWTFAIHQFNGFHWSTSRTEPSQEEIERYPDVVIKWQNTRDFHQRVCQSCGRRPMRLDK